jgi:hypothetical protein
VTIAERIAAFQHAFPGHPAAWPHQVQEAGHDVLYAVWVLGADYKTRSTLYGAFPHRFLPYLLALFPDVRLSDILHACAGSVKPGPWTRLDVHPDTAARTCSAASMTRRRCSPGVTFPLVIVDPPYSSDDAKRSTTRRRSIPRRPCARSQRSCRPAGTARGSITQWPMHNKREWITVGRCYIQRSTKHRTRVCTIFQRAGVVIDCARGWHAPSVFSPWVEHEATIERSETCSACGTLLATWSQNKALEAQP